MVKSWLQEILKIRGVEGTFIASNRANILSKISHEYKDHQLKSIAVRVLRIMAAFHLKGKKATEIELYWEDRYVICKNTGVLLLVTICRDSSALALLRITLNVTLANILEDKDFQKTLRRLSADKSRVLQKGEFEEKEKKLLSKIN